MIQKKKKNNKRRQYRKNYVTLVVILFLLFVVTFYFLLFTDFFIIKQIQVINIHSVKEEEILLKSGLNEGENIFRFNKNNVAKSIEKIPYVKCADIVRVFPNTIKIYIEEREALGAIFYENKFIYVDGEEIILEYNDTLSTNIPMISLSNDTIGTVVIGDKVQLQPEWIKRNLFQILRIAKDNEILSYFSEINVTEDNIFHLYTKSGSLIKVRNSNTVEEKIDFIKTFLLDGEERMIIDLTHGGNPTYIPR